MSSPVWFGDISVCFLVDEDTSIEKDDIQKNFVDSYPQSYELTADLESGVYSVIHNETIHSRNETFREQMDGVHSMASRHPAELPVSFNGNKGHVLVEEVNSSITSSQEFQESELSIRFFESDRYKPAYIVEAGSFNDIFDSAPIESLLPLPTTVENVEGNDGSITPEFTLTGEEGEYDYYIYSDRDTISYDRNPDDYTGDERINPVRIYDDHDERIYSELQEDVLSGSVIDNGFMRVTFNDQDSSIEVYDGSDWEAIGDVNFEIEPGFVLTNTNDNVDVSFINDNGCSVSRGHLAIEFTDTSSEFIFDAESTVTVVDDSSSWYYTVEIDGEEYSIVRTSNDGDFTSDSESFGVTNLSETENTFFFVKTPSDVSTDDYIRYIYNDTYQERTMVQK